MFYTWRKKDIKDTDASYIIFSTFILIFCFRHHWEKLLKSGNIETLLLSPARYYLHASKKTGNKYSSPSRFGYHFPFPLLKGDVPKFSRFAKFVRAILKYVDRYNHNSYIHSADAVSTDYKPSCRFFTFKSCSPLPHSYYFVTKQFEHFLILDCWFSLFRQCNHETQNTIFFSITTFKLIT